MPIDEDVIYNFLLKYNIDGTFNFENVTVNKIAERWWRNKAANQRQEIQDEVEDVNFGEA